jgi:acetyl-CoA acetyltransferase
VGQAGGGARHRAGLAVRQRRHDPEHTITLGQTAERVAALDGISREDSDAFGLQSQERAQKAVDNGAFDGEIVPC